MKYETQPTLPPPASMIGIVGWARKHLFNGPINSIATLLLSYLLITLLTPTIQWLFIDADWVGDSRDACTSGGACWVFISNRLDQFYYGFYPEEEYWRLNLAFILLLASIVWLIVPQTPKKGLMAIFLLLVYPVIAFFLLYGDSFGLVQVETHLWGGLSLTLVLAVVGIVASLPLGILLALGAAIRDADSALCLRHLYRNLARCAIDYSAVHGIGHAAAVFP